MVIKLDRDLIKEIAGYYLSNPKWTDNIATWRNNEGLKYALINRNCNYGVITALRSFPILDFLGAYRCVYLSLCHDGIGLETPSACQTSMPVNLEYCVCIPIDLQMLKFLLKTYPEFIRKFYIAFSAWKDQVLKTLKHTSLDHLSCHVKADRAEYMYYGKEISRILLENSKTLKRLDVARYFCDAIPYFDLDLEAMNITFSHYQNSRDGFDQLVAQNLRAKSLTLNIEWKNVGTNWAMFSDFFQNVHVEELRLAMHTFIYQRSLRKPSPNSFVKRVYVQFESFFHMNLEQFFVEVAESFPNLELLYIMPDVSDRHPFENVDLCLKKVSNLKEGYYRTLEHYEHDKFQITIDILGAFRIDNLNKPLQEKLRRVPYGFSKKDLTDEERAKNYCFSFGCEEEIASNRTLLSKVLIL